MANAGALLGTGRSANSRVDVCYPRIRYDLLLDLITSTHGAVDCTQSWGRN